MNQLWDFLRAAAPWVAAGLCVAILAVRGAVKKKNNKQDGDYGTEGMCLGMCFGLLFGTMFENGTALGISLGMLLGLALGTCISKTRKDEKR